MQVSEYFWYIQLVWVSWHVRNVYRNVFTPVYWNFQLCFRCLHNFRLVFRYYQSRFWKLQSLFQIFGPVFRNCFTSINSLNVNQTFSFKRYPRYYAILEVDF